MLLGAAMLPSVLGVARLTGVPESLDASALPAVSGVVGPTVLPMPAVPLCITGVLGALGAVGAVGVPVLLAVSIRLGVPMVSMLPWPSGPTGSTRFSGFKVFVSATGFLLCLQYDRPQTWECEVQDAHTPWVACGRRLLEWRLEKT
jgi:hypothetical protein